MPSVERELGGLFLVGFDGTTFDAELRDLMDDLDPAGVILFSRNIETPLQTAELTAALQKHAEKRRPEGLFIGVDQEGGRVARFRRPFKEFPPMLTLASESDPEADVARFAVTTARELRLVGINLDFAPVMDVLSYSEDLQSTVIGDRSFGADPQIVSKLGRIIVKTFRSFGLIPCCKHFPGHGGTLIDSHITMPVDTRSRIDIEADLTPFNDAINDNIEMIMTAHVQYDALDPALPATVSPTIITSLLREQMGYQGVVVTDDLDMGAIANSYTPEEASVLAIKAGADLLMFCNNPSKAFSARSAIAQSISDGEISDARIEQSLQRIRSLKQAIPGLKQIASKKQVTGHFTV